MLSKVRLPSWVTSPTFILGLLWLLTAIADRTWFALDQASPAWDQGEHLNKALNIWRVWQAPEKFTSAWWIDLWQQAPTYRAPLTYLFTLPILQWVGRSYDDATYVNLIFTAILLTSVYHLGKHLFFKSVGLWAAIFCAIAPFLVFQRTDYLLDYPLGAIATFTYLCMSKWRDTSSKWHSWTWAIASGIGVGACFLTRGTGIIFIFLPCLWLVGGTLWRRQWLRLLQLVLLFLTAWFVIGGWFTTNWLTIISSTLQTNALGKSFYDVPQANTLAGWLFYAKMLPDMFSPILLFASLGCWILFIGRRAWRKLAIVPALVKIPTSKITDSDAAPETNVNSVPQRSTARTWRWLALFTLGTYILVTFGTHKLNRFILPYIPSMAIVLAYGFTLGKGKWWQGFRVLVATLASLSVFIHQFPISSGIGVVGDRHFPYFGAAYPQQEVIQAISQEQPYLKANLGVLTNTAELNPMSLDFFGASMGFQVYGRQVGMNPKDAEKDARSLTWYITKNGEQGDYTNLEAGLAALKPKLETNPDLQIAKQWKLPDGSELYLHRRNPLPLTVTPIKNVAQSSPSLQLISANVPSQAPNGQPIPITYTWQGSWDTLKNAIVLLTWQQQNGQAYWIHDHEIAFGNLYQAPTDQSTNNQEFLVTEVTAMLPTASLPNDTYILKATLLDRKTGLATPLNIPSVQIQLGNAPAIPAPELDFLTQLRQMTTLLPAGKIDPIFVQLATINQYDPTQDYVLQAEKSLSYRLQQASPNDPNTVPFLYNLAFTYILQKQPQPAIATFEKLTTLEPQNPYAWTYLGFVNLYSFQGAKAQAAFDQATKINPNLPELRTLNIVAAVLQFNIPKAWQLLNTPA